MRTGHHCVRGFIPPVNHCAMRLSLWSSPLCHAIVCRLPPCHGIVHAVHHCVRGFIPPVHHCVVGMFVVHHCAMQLSLRHSAMSWDCHSGSAIRARHDPSGSPLRHGIYPLHHYAMVLSFCGLPLCHGIVHLVHNCVMGLPLRLSPVSCGCPSDSQLWFCPSGSSPVHGTDPVVHRWVMGLLVWFTSVPYGIVPLVRRHVTGLFLGYTALSWDSPLISPLYYGISHPIYCRAMMQTVISPLWLHAPDHLASDTYFVLTPKSGILDSSFCRLDLEAVH